ncbi:MAG: glucokinase [Nitrospirota bacterium]|nr:glucokinase [Nitrospirota bacterium]
MILAGDIGGTKTLLGLYEGGNPRDQRNSRPLRVLEKSYPSRRYPTFDLVLEEFLSEAKSTLSDSLTITFASFGVAGPVVHGRCETTNLPWVLDTDSLSTLLSIDRSRVFLINDLAAIAWGTMFSSEKNLIVLNEGVPDKQGNQVIVAPGTGLGESIIAYPTSGPIVISTEGGHSDWAPGNPDDFPLFSYLWARYGHVSIERLVSGQGLANLYRFYTRNLEQSNLPLDPLLSDEMIPAALTHAAMTLKNPLCTRILDYFCSLLGQEAGNMVLKSLATGGVFLAGGIPEKILPFLLNSSFMEHFTNKGRYTKLLENIPVRIVNDPEIGILGAWAYATSHQ